MTRNPTTNGGMRCRIHRGAREIGGNCIELEASGMRVVLDLGLPLNTARGETVPLPPVSGFAEPDPSLLGVVLSHSHLDHVGLTPSLRPEVPVFIGAAASRILHEAAFFGAAPRGVSPHGLLRHRQPLVLGPFRITPILADHSAFDAYSLLIEAGGSRLFYSGDLRAHGRTRARFEALLRHPPHVDVALLEGTHVRSRTAAPARGPSECEVEDDCAQTFTSTRGLAFTLFSPQNVDRLVSVYRAARRAGRDLVIDLYAASIAAATGLTTIPQAHWPHVRVYLPRAQRARILRHGSFERTDAVRARRIYRDEIIARRSELVLAVRPSTIPELAPLGALADASAVWSQWQGYLDAPSSAEFRTLMSAHEVPIHLHHASGHAHVHDLQRLAAALSPARIVPIHSEAPARFVDHFANVTPHPDGDWWQV